MSEPVLQVEGLDAGYGEVQVLKGVNLSVFQGEVVAVIGANGAGKTTLLQTISALHPPTAGRILFKGAEIQHRPAHQLVGEGLVHVPEGRQIFARLTVRENLELGAFLRRDTLSIAEDFERVFQLFPILAERANQLGGTLSGGEQQMLAIARGLMSKPQLMIMDEPSMGVAPLLVEKIYQAIRDLNQHGLTLLLVEQNATVALNLAHRGYVLETGQILFEDSGVKLLQDPRVCEAYLGN